MFAVPPEQLAGGGWNSKAAVFPPTSWKHNPSLWYRADCRFNGVKRKVGGGELPLSLFDELVCFSLHMGGTEQTDWQAV